MKTRITMPMHDTRNRRYPIRARLLLVVAGILLLAGLPAGTDSISSAAPAAAQAGVVFETPQLRPGLLAAMQRRAGFTRAIRGPVASPFEGDATDSGPVAASFYTGERVYSAWHHNGEEIVFAAFTPQGEVAMQPQVIGFGRWPRIASNGDRVAIAWYFADGVLVRVYDGSRWGDGYDLLGTEPALAFAPGGDLYAATTEGLWKLSGDQFERVEAVAYSQPALAIDRQGTPRVASVRDGHIIVGDEDLGEGERPALTSGPDGELHAAYIAGGSLVLRSLAEGVWSRPEIIPAENPAWPALAAGDDGVRLSFLGAADHGPDALWLVRLPDREPLLMPSLAGNVTEAWLMVNFNLRYARSSYLPHDVDVLVNGIIVGQFRSTVPDGRYLFRLNPAQIFTAFGSHATNRVAVRTRHMNAGHYSVSSEYVLAIRTEWSEKFAFASNTIGVTNATDSEPTNHDEPDLAVLANGLDLPVEMPAPGRIEFPVVVANLGEAGSRPTTLQMLDTEEPGANVLSETPVSALEAGQQVTMTVPLEYDGKLERVIFRVAQDGADFEPENDSLTLMLWELPTVPVTGGTTDASGNVQATQTAVAGFGSGIRLQKASWVPELGFAGHWSAVRTGRPASETAATSTTDIARLVPGQYDVYWTQDTDHSTTPLLLAEKVNVEAGRLTTVNADSGVQLDAAQWVPEFGFAGYWSAVRAGDAADERVHWASAPGQALLLPPGRYDLYWVQDTEHSSIPLLLASEVTVEQGKLATMRAESGIQLDAADWVPEFGFAGYWGAVRAGDAAGERVHWADDAGEPLLLPPGEYDLYWVQDTNHSGTPLLLASRVEVQQGDVAAVAARSGARLDLGDWVPDFGFAGYWGVVRAGDPASERVHWADTGTDPLLLPPGEYDVYWVQDSNHNGRPLLLASGIRVDEDEVAVVAANSGIRLDVAPSIPEFGFAGYWGVVRAGDPASERVHWADTGTDPLLLPPGEYDVYWVQDSNHSGRPMLLAAGVRVEPGQDVVVPARSGVRLRLPANTPPPGADVDYWGAVPAGGDPDDRVNWSSDSYDRPILLPPGTYDIVWKEHSQSGPVILKEDVVVERAVIVEVDVQPPN